MFDLNITRFQIDFIGKGAAQNNLNNEEISQIHLFTPSIKQQQKIVECLDEAHLKKEQKEAEAQQLLNSIDDYLLNELGIDLSKVEENTLQSRIFHRNFSKILGSRFDAPAYFKELLLPSALFPMKKFKDCVSMNPLTIFSSFGDNTQATFIPMENVSEIYGEAGSALMHGTEENQATPPR